MKCSIARALDIVGERWTLLLIRELLTGPKRYKDLMLGLTGIGTNLLADRLKALEKSGLIQREKPTGHASYVLTDAGRELEPALIYLARWGLKHGVEGSAAALDLPSWNVLAFKAVFDPERAKKVRETYEVHIGEFVFSIRVRDGTIETRANADWQPDLTLRFSEHALSRISRRLVSFEDEIKQGGVVVEGSARTLRRFTEIFSLDKVLSGPLQVQ